MKIARIGAAILAILLCSIAWPHGGRGTPPVFIDRPAGVDNRTSGTFDVHWTLPFADPFARIDFFAARTNARDPIYPDLPAGLAVIPIGGPFDGGITDGGFSWDAGGLPEGSYFVAAVLDDIKTRIVTFSPGVVTVLPQDGGLAAPALVFSSPPDEGLVADTTAKIAWNAEALVAPVTIALSYSTYSDSTRVPIATLDATRTAALNLDVSQYAKDAYAIHGTLTDGLGRSAEAWARGSIAVFHPRTAPADFDGGDAADAGSLVHPGGCSGCSSSGGACFLPIILLLLVARRRAMHS